MLDTPLIEKALALTGKTMEDMKERYVVYANATTNTGIVKYRFSIEKFCYYLLSPEFIDKYHNTIHTYPIEQPIPYWDIAYCISEYQSGNETPLVELLKKI